MSYTKHPTANPHKRKRTNQDSEDIAWTAARCNRLLRTISSRISTLRRLISIDIDGNHDAKARIPPKRATEHWSTADPVWLPGGNNNRKAQAKTYTAKEKSMKQRKLQSRAINMAFPSPFIKRMGSYNDDKENQRPEDDCVQKKTIPTKTRRSRQLPILSTSEIQEAERGLEQSLAKLLSTTAEANPAKSIGASSLMRTCLRRVPAYVDLQDDSEENEDIEDCATSEVLEYLEGFSTREGYGWEGLREVVRSQGVHQICRAIQDRLLSENIMHCLLKVCSTHKAVYEGQHIIQAWLLSAGNTSPRIEKLHDFCTKHNCEGFRYRSLCKVAEMGLESHGKLMESPQMETTLLSSLSGPFGPEALRFLHEWTIATIREDSLGALKERQRNALRSVMMKITVLGMAGLVLNGSTHFDSCRLREAMYSVQTSLVLTQKKPTRKVASLRSMVEYCTQTLASLECRRSPRPLLLNGVVSLHLFAYGSGFVYGDPRHTTVRSLQEDFATECVESIAALESHLQLGLPELVLKRVVEAIDEAAPLEELLRTVALELLATMKQAGHVEDEMQYAELLYQVVPESSRKIPPKTPRGTSIRSRYRWDEGLCEFVTATPFPGHGAPTNDDSGVEVDEDGVDDCTKIDKDIQQQTTEYEGDSPDVLAMSCRAKRFKPEIVRRSRSPYEGRKGIVVVYRSKKANKRRKSKRISEQRSVGDSSGDELGF